jgi:alcohol dehydrogenase (NADP+)
MCSFQSTRASDGYAGSLAELVPRRHLYTGAEMPAIGLGTFGSDHASAAEVAEAVRGAIAIGYRHIDCAAVYMNEDSIGQVFDEYLLSGLAREDLWITSKLWNDKHGEHEVIPACEKSIADLRCGYLDSYLVHWPFPNFHPPGCTAESRSPEARPYIHEQFMRTWRQMERLVELGLVRHIGTSNMTIPKLKLLLRDARIRPAMNEMEMHPHFQQPELFAFLRSNGIEAIAYTPLGSPNRPERDRTPEDTSPLDEPVIARIAGRRGWHPAAVCIRWSVQHGATPIPFSTKARNYRANLEAAIGEPLSEDEMHAISAIDKNCRLIKGQVFLWKAGQSWEDLWDIKGEITPL